MSFFGFGKKSEFPEFAKHLVEDRSIDQWIDRKIQQAVQQLRSGARQVQLSESQPLAIVAPPEIREVEKIVYVDKPVDRIVEKNVEVCPTWAKGLEHYAALLPAIRTHASLSRLLLGETTHDDSIALLHWLTRSGQWSTVEQVWQTLAVQVQQQDRAATATEQQILATSVALYNQSISRGAASLVQPSVGQRYDYEQHTRVNHSGESVAAVRLAGLCNAQGKLVQLSLVHTH